MQVGRSIDTRVFRVNTNWVEQYKHNHPGEYPRCSYCNTAFYVNNICFTNTGRCYCINCSIIAGIVDIRDYDSWVAGLEKANRLKPETVKRLLEMGILKEKSVRRLEKYIEKVTHIEYGATTGFVLP